MLRLLLPFLYEDLLTPLMTEASLNRALLYGGRGLGKTTLLRRVQRKLVPGSSRTRPPEDDTPQATWVDKRSSGAAQRIVRWCLKPRGTLIVDDFDQIFDPQVDNALLSLKDAEDTGFRVLLASRRPPRVLERDVLQQKQAAGLVQATPWDESRAVPTLSAQRLNPWLGDWKARLDAAYAGAFGRVRQELRSRVVEERVEDAMALLPSRAPLTAWVEVVLQASGGHPALVDGSFELLLSLAFNELTAMGWLSADDPLVAELRTRTRFALAPSLTAFGLASSGEDDADDRLRTLRLTALEDYLLERQMVHLDRSLAHLGASEPDALAALQALAKDPEGTLIEDGRHRLLLLDTGLVYKKEKPERLALPEGLVREAILAMDPPTQQAPLPGTAPAAPVVGTGDPRILSVTVSEGPKEGQGDVIVETITGRRLLKLRGRPWQVFEFLWKNAGRFVQAEELMEPLGIPTIYSTRNAILRLNQEIKAADVEGVVENRKGAGYRVRGGGGG